MSRTSSLRSRRGNATVISVITLFVIGSLAGVILVVAQRHSGEVSALADQNRAFFVVDSALNDTLARLETGELVLAEEGDTLALGDAQAPLEDFGGRYWLALERNDRELFRLTAHGRVGLQQKSVEVVARREEEGVYRNAIFAGNSSNDAGYALELSGTLTQADKVLGDVYSGGNVVVSGDAEVDGTIRALGTAAGKGSSAAELGKKQAIPDIPAMNYAKTADILVADEFASGSPDYRANPAGGSAWELGESNPAHIFRKNPSDRTSEIDGTVKDDFFLEDPYEPVRDDSKSDGSNAYPITLSGVSGESGKDSNRLVFFIDGNLWIHNYQTMSLQFAHAEASGLQVAFVVKGNIYISDNLYYSNNDKDGVAFIAMKDEAVADSGNIYFGDPRFGTLERMYAYLYAENNFHDVNLSATGSARVELHGNMTAGNHVKIRRDFDTSVDGKTVVQHSRLLVDFDERLARGELDIPGLPRTPAAEAARFEILSWREVERE